MEKHLTILGTLYIAFSSVGVLIAVIVFITIGGGGLLSGEIETIAITSSVGTAIALLLVLVSAPGIIGGIGILKRQSWARILVLVLAFLYLIEVPYGTALGIYTIWILMNDKTEKLFISKKKA
ncbi:hypothetical protein KAW18_05400 [candidate division WOR-3 bacterium]|nr:hypothetical protein [candidate division WOR-3 bacterium]